MDQKYTEGSPWFWKLFGSTLIGVISVMFMVIMNTMNNTIYATRQESTLGIAQIKLDLENNVSKIKEEITLLKTQLAALDEFRSSTKEKIVSLESGIKERASYSEQNVNKLQQQIKEHEDRIREIREAILLKKSE